MAVSSDYIQNLLDSGESSDDVMRDVIGQDAGNISQAMDDMERAGNQAKKNFATEPLPTMPQAPSFTDIVGNLFTQKQMAKGANAYGSRGSTYLTGPLGDTSMAPIGTKTTTGS